METIRDTRAFFESYAAANNNHDLKAIAAHYAEGFVAATPQGNGAFKNDDSFIEWLKQVEEYYRKTGMQDMRVVQTKDFPISKDYTQVVVTWGVKYKKTGDELITFDISYFLYLKDGPKIVMYIAHEDEQELMKEKGLLSS